MIAVRTYMYSNAHGTPGVRAVTNRVEGNTSAAGHNLQAKPGQQRLRDQQKLLERQHDAA